MPDITMCSPSQIEKICKTCHRFNAKPSYRQAYSRFTPNKNGTDCDYYLEPRKGDRKWDT